MFFSLYDLLAWGAACGLLYFWWHSMGQRDKALKFARHYCQQHGYQLLDETLAGNGFAFLRDGRDRSLFCRRYTFDVSTTGEDRYSGEIALYGQHVIRAIINLQQREISIFPE